MGQAIAVRQDFTAGLGDPVQRARSGRPDQHGLAWLTTEA